ncbi:MAG: AzlC family ABC transporter permease [Candidatus Heteroscillospira sp.]
MKKTFLCAFRHSLPVLFGFLPLGLAYGILMQESGYGAGWTALCSSTVLAGSLQFLMVSFFGGGFSILTVALLALSLNSRHIFYGLSFIERFRSCGAAKWFLIFTLTDEAYSLHCSFEPEDGVNENAAHIIIGALVMFYWVLFSVLGALAGSLISFDTTGLDFALTALFITILIDQIRAAESYAPALMAAAASAVSLLIFGADGFILPALILSTAGLFLLRREPKKEAAK